jgi:hypothetical protein
MGPARIYPWRKMHRSPAPSIAPGTFFVAQPWADCITNMPGFNLRQAQGCRAVAGSRRGAGSPGLAAIALDFEPTEPAMKTLPDCRGRLSRTTVPFHPQRPRVGLGAIRLTSGLHGLFARMLGAHLRRPDAAPQMNSRDLVLMTANYSGLCFVLQHPPGLAEAADRNHYLQPPTAPSVFCPAPEMRNAWRWARGDLDACPPRASSAGPVAARGATKISAVDWKK